jgi:hypothetical protein
MHRTGLHEEGWKRWPPLCSATARRSGRSCRTSSTCLPKRASSGVQEMRSQGRAPRPEENQLAAECHHPSILTSRCAKISMDSCVRRFKSTMTCWKQPGRLRLPRDGPSEKSFPTWHDEDCALPRGIPKKGAFPCFECRPAPLPSQERWSRGLWRTLIDVSAGREPSCGSCLAEPRSPRSCTGLVQEASEARVGHLPRHSEWLHPCVVKPRPHPGGPHSRRGGRSAARDRRPLRA